MFPRILVTVLIFVLMSVSSGGERAGVFVLVYHSFLGTGEYPTDVSLDDLKWHLDSLRLNGYRFVSFSELAYGKITGFKNILVTVDDGNRSFYKAYSGVFRPLGIKPLIAIYPHVIGHSPRALSWEQLKELSSDGCEIASHGYYHLYVNRKLYDTNRMSFLREIYESKAVLEKNLDRKITVFVYPYGVGSEITRTTLKDAGYKYAFTLTWGPLLVPLEMNADPFELPRYMHIQGNWNIITGHMLKNTPAR